MRTATAHAEVKAEGEPQGTRARSLSPSLLSAISSSCVSESLYGVAGAFGNPDHATTRSGRTVFFNCVQKLNRYCRRTLCTWRGVTSPMVSLIKR